MHSYAEREREREEFEEPLYKYKFHDLHVGQGCNRIAFYAADHHKM